MLSPRPSATAASAFGMVNEGHGLQPFLMGILVSVLVGVAP